MKTTLVAVLAALALALGFAAPASAGTGTNGPLTITAPDQVMRSGCYNYQMTYSADAPHWSLQTDVTRTGALGDSDFVFGDGPKSGLTSAFLCSGLSGPGTYTVRAVLTSHDADYNELPNIETSTTFVLSAPYVPPTPIPAPVPAPLPAPAPAPVVKVATTTGIAVVSSTGKTVRTLKRTKTAYVGTMLRRGTRWTNGARVTLQSHRAHRAWGTVATRTTATMSGHKGMAIIKVRPLATTYYRWIFKGTTVSKASHSTTSRIKVTR